MTNGTGSPSADRTWRAAAGRGAKAGVPRRSGQDHVPSGVRLGRDASAKTRRPASAVPATMVSPPPTYAIAIPPVASPNRIGRSAGIASITRPPAATAAPTTRAKRESRSTYTEGDVTVAGALTRAGSAWGREESSRSGPVRSHASPTSAGKIRSRPQRPEPESQATSPPSTVVDWVFGRAGGVTGTARMLRFSDSCALPRRSRKDFLRGVLVYTRIDSKAKAVLSRCPWRLGPESGEATGRWASCRIGRKPGC